MAGLMMLSLKTGMLLMADHTSTFIRDGLWGKVLQRFDKLKSARIALKKLLRCHQEVYSHFNCILRCLRLMPNIKHKINLMIFQESKLNHWPKNIAWRANYVPGKQGMTYKNNIQPASSIIWPHLSPISKHFYGVALLTAFIIKSSGTLVWIFRKYRL